MHIRMASDVNDYMISIGKTVYSNDLVDDVFETI